MNASFIGKHVRLAVEDSEQYAKIIAGWGRDSEYQQLLGSGPAWLTTPKQIQEWIEKEPDNRYNFSIRILEDDHPIGFVDLDGVDWVAGNCWVGIGIGERGFWGKGYGSEAMDLALRFAFQSLNLKRVSLDVFQYNTRAYQSYRKCGFKDEGRMRQWMQRGGERHDLIFMGILREEWNERNSAFAAENGKEPAPVPSAGSG